MRLISSLAGVALGLAAVPSLAADLSYGKAPGLPMLAAPGFSWSGFYAGVQLGHTWGNDYTKEYLTTPWTYVGLINFFKPTGWSYGAHAGANYQLGALVLGVEADIEAGSIRGGFVDPPAAPFNPGGAGRTSMELQGSLRARLGYAFGRVLVYGTAGLALARFDATYANWAGVTEGFDKTIGGYTLGAGVELAVTDNVTIRGEFRHTDWGRFKNHSQVAFPGFSGVQRPTYNTVRVGASYRF